MRVFALKNTDSVREISSSGGAFLAIAESFFRENSDYSVVYGVKFDSDLIPRYCYVDSLEQCRGFCGSKYVSPRLDRTIITIQELLKYGKHIMFVGLPCHVYAVKKVIEKNGIDAKNLLLVDLVCNGVPDGFVWKDYKSFIEKTYESRLVDFKFRFKGDRLNPYRTAALLENGNMIIDSNLTASYNRLYLQKLIIRKACFSCPFRRKERNGDITIGDFWGINGCDRNFNDDKGVSIVITSTDKGDRIISNVTDESRIKEFGENIMDTTQENLSGISEPPLLYQAFWEDYKQGMVYILSKYADGGVFGKFKHKTRQLYRLYKYYLYAKRGGGYF